MLRRVAEAVYWMGRYIERSENIARQVDVSQAFALGGRGGLDAQWAALVYASGEQELFKTLGGTFTHDSVLNFLLFERKNPNSILSCMTQARENARQVRDVLSMSLWESINRFYLRVREASAKPGLSLQNPALLLERIRRGSHEVVGVTEATMSQGEVFHFAKMGRLLERADQTSRMLDVKYFILLPETSQLGSALDVVQWSALLESTSALHMYRRRYGPIVPHLVTTFLILDEQFPRSLKFCVAEAERAMREILRHDNDEESDHLRTVFRAVTTHLESATPESLVQHGLHEFIDDVQQRLNELSHELFQRFFELPSSEVVEEALQQ